MGRAISYNEHHVRPLKDTRLLEFPDLMDSVNYVMEAYYTSKSVEERLDEQIKARYISIETSLLNRPYEASEVLNEALIAKDTLMCNLDRFCLEFSQRIKVALEVFQERIVEHLDSTDKSLSSNRELLK